MLRRLLSVGVVFAALASTLAMPSPAAAAGPSAYQQVLRVYQSQGTVPACRFSGVELADALKGVDTYGAQYFADFTQAVQSALSARAAGACAPAPAPAPAAAAPVGGVPEPPAHFGSVTAATSAGIPAPLAAMAVLALAAGLFGAWTLLARSRARR